MQDWILLSHQDCKVLTTMSYPHYADEKIKFEELPTRIVCLVNSWIWNTAEWQRNCLKIGESDWGTFLYQEVGTDMHDA